MKRIILSAGVVLLSIFSLTSVAQTEEVPVKTETAKTWEARKNPTVEEINARYENKLIPARAPLTNEDIFPALGTYESTTNADAPSVTISLDANSKGIVWVEGLPQGKIKAMLRKSPATYKIPEQKNAEGKEVAEGTLIFDKETNTLSILVGKSYNAADPESVFAVAEEAANEPELSKVKTKEAEQSKTWTYVGTKVVTKPVDAPATSDDL